MAKLTVIENGISSADLHTAINFNFSFLNALVSVPATLVTIDNTMAGQTLIDNLNLNFTRLNAKVVAPISLSSLTLGITGATLNALFNSMNIALGKVADGKGYFIEYYVSDLHLCATRGKKVLAFDGVNTLSLSTNGGLTFPTTLQIIGMEDMVQYAYIWENGDINFFTHTHAYYSKDSLATYHECTLSYENGDPVTLATYDNFRPVGVNDPIYVNGVEMSLIGRYTTAGNYDKIWVWYSVDATIYKIAYQNSVTAPISTMDHIHVISYNPADGYFYLQSGDGVGKAGWIRGTYNSVTKWSWSQFALSDSVDTFFQTNGFVFDGNYVYISCEAKKGVYKSLYSDILNTANYEKLFTSNDSGIWTINSGVYNGEIVLSEGYGGKTVVISIDKTNFNKHTIVGGVVIQGYLTVKPKNDDGYYLFEIWANDGTETLIQNLNKAQVLMLRVVK